MKKFLLSLLLIIGFCTTAQSQRIAQVVKTKIQSQVLDQERELLIYTPAGYNEFKNKYYDVIYVFDAQNRVMLDLTSSLTHVLSNTKKEFIIVGITSFYSEDVAYTRNNDLLPKLTSEHSIKRYGEYSGNADNFKNFISTEVVPFIDANYRTRYSRTAVGHSLSASLILSLFLDQTEVFDNYIAISPNLAYNNDELANRLINFDYEQLDKEKFIYLSHANESIDWPIWKPAREKVYSFFYNRVIDNLEIKRDEFPTETHWSTLAPSLTSGIKAFLNYEANKSVELSDETYEVQFTIKVPKASDEVFITGNQNALGNWDPKKIKLEKTSDFERSITLEIQAPAEIKFTRGTWESEALLKGTGSAENFRVEPDRQSTYNFEVLYWADGYKEQD